MLLGGNASSLPLRSDSIDLCLTSPPYWKKRDYGHQHQLGQESTPEKYVEALLAVLREIRRVLKPTGSLFLNIGDTYFRRSLVGIPFLVERAAASDGWRVRNRIVWAKPRGVPTPHRDRLANRHEVILHLAGPQRYYYDLDGLCQQLGTRFPGGDVWEIAPGRHRGSHPAAFPDELARRVVALACPSQVCKRCGAPRHPISTRTQELDLSRQQARRAMEIATEHGLTAAHFAAIRATGISDAGKGARLQRGGDQNTEEVRTLAREAKTVLGGYFREFTFGGRSVVGRTKCPCSKGWTPGTVLDVFAGTATTLRAAAFLGRHSVGVDLGAGTELAAQRDHDSVTQLRLRRSRVAMRGRRLATGSRA